MTDQPNTQAGAPTDNEEECVVLERKDGTIFKIPYSELDRFKVERDQVPYISKKDGFGMMVPGISCKVKCST